jgi:hypothetical protein
MKIVESLCKSCGAKVIWVKGPKGTPMPLNARRVRGYILVDQEDHTGDRIAEPTEEPVYISHFVTCPEASEWSKGKP